jgi:hypothetical protein
MRKTGMATIIWSMVTLPQSHTAANHIHVIFTMHNGLTDNCCEIVVFVLAV